MGNGLTNRDLNVELDNLTQSIADIIAQVEEDFSAFFTTQMQNLIKMSKNATSEEEKSINDKISALASLVKFKSLVDPSKPRVIIDRLVYVNKENIEEVTSLFEIINAPLLNTVTKEVKSDKAKEPSRVPYQTIKRKPKELRANNKLIFDLQKYIAKLGALDGENKQQAKDGNFVVASKIREYESLLNLREILNKANSSNDVLTFTLDIAYVREEDQKIFDSVLVSSDFYQENYIKPAQINAENDNLINDLESYLKSLEQAYNSYQGTTIESGITRDNTTVLAKDVQVYDNIREMIDILNDRAKSLKSAWNVGHVRNKNLARYMELVRNTITTLVNISPKFGEIPGVEANLPFILDIEAKLKNLKGTNEEIASLNTLYNALLSSIGLSNLKEAQDGALIDKKLLKTYEQNLNPLLEYARRKEAAESLVNILTNIRAIKESAMVPKERILLALPEHKVRVRAQRPAKNVITPDVIALPGVTLEMIERAKKVKELIDAFLEADKYSNTSYLDDILKRVIEDTLNPKPLVDEKQQNNVILALPPHLEEAEVRKPNRPLKVNNDLVTPDIIALTGEVLEIDPELSAKIYKIIDNPTVKGILDVIAYAASKDKELQAELNGKENSGLVESPLVRVRSLNDSLFSQMSNFNHINNTKGGQVENSISASQLALPPKEEMLALEVGTPNVSRAIPLGGEVASSSGVIALPEVMPQVDEELQFKINEVSSNPTIDNVLDLLNYREAKHKEFEQKLDEVTKETEQQVVTRRRVAENKQNDIRLALPPKEEMLALEAGTPNVSRAIPLGGEVAPSSEVIPLPESMIQEDSGQEAGRSDLTVDDILKFLDGRDAKHKEFEQKLDEVTKETEQQVVTRRRVVENSQNGIRLALPPKEEILALEAGTPVVSKAIPLRGEIASSSEVIPLPESMAQEGSGKEVESDLTVDDILKFLDGRDAKHKEFEQKLDEVTKETEQQVVTRRRVAENKQNDIRLALPPKEEILALEAGTPIVSRAIPLGGEVAPSSEVIPLPESMAQEGSGKEVESDLTVDDILKFLDGRDAKHEELQNELDRISREAEGQTDLPTESISSVLSELNVKESLVNVLSAIKSLKISEEEKRKVLADESLTRKLIDKFLELTKYDEPNPEKTFMEEKLLKAFEALINSQQVKASNDTDGVMLSLPSHKVRSLRPLKTLGTPEVIALDGEVLEIHEELPIENISNVLSELNVKESLVNVLGAIKSLKISEEEKRKVLADKSLTRKLIDKFLELTKYDEPNPEKTFMEEKLLKAFEALINPQQVTVINDKDDVVLSLPPHKVKSLRSLKTLETPEVIALDGEVLKKELSPHDEALKRLRELSRNFKISAGVSQVPEIDTLQNDQVETGDLLSLEIPESIVPAERSNFDETQSILDEVRALIAENSASLSTNLPAVAPDAKIAVPSKGGKRLAAKPRKLNFGSLSSIREKFSTLAGKGLKNSLNWLRTNQDNYGVNPEDTREMLFGIKETFDKRGTTDNSMDLPTLIRFPMPQSEDQILTDCQNEVTSYENQIAALKSIIDAAPIWNLCVQEREKINELRLRIRDCKSKVALKFLDKYKQALANGNKTSANNYRLLIFALINVDVCSSDNLAKVQYEIEYAPGLTEKDRIDELQEMKDRILAANAHNPIQELAVIDSEFINIIDKTIEEILAGAKYSIDPELKFERLKQLIRSKTG